MSCINKSDKGYRALANIYGDALAEAFVRSYPLNKRGENVDYYIPTNTEVKFWLTEQKNNISKNIKRALKINPYMSEDAIKHLLKGVISKYKGTYFITTGWLYNGSQALTQETLKTVYEPNLKIMEGLYQEFPEIFTLRSTKNSNTVVVEITPQVKPEEDEIPTEIDNRPEIAKSMDTYKSLVERNNGKKPAAFLADGFKWVMNENELYNLVYPANNMSFLKNIDLETGTVVPEPEEATTPINEARRDRMFRSIMQMIKQQHIDSYLAEKGIDTADIYEDLRYAETEQDLNKISETLLKALC
jgi:hypothetical protein